MEYLKVLDVTAVAARPGDLVVVRSDAWSLTDEQKNHTLEKFRSLFPNNEVIVIDARFSVEVKPAEV